MQTKIYKSSSQFNLSINHNFLIRKKCLFIILAAMFMAAFNHAYAEDAVPDKFRIALGGYAVPGFESSMSLVDRDLGAGVSISPEDVLGLKTEQTVLRLDGRYRFTRKHSLTFSWYSINSDGNKSLEEEIDWVDGNGDPITIPIGANVDTNLDYDIYKLGYLWSFHNTDKVELSAGAGLHITRIAIGLAASTTSTGVEARNVSTSVPLPVLSFALTYKVTPKFAWHLKSEFFALSFDDWEGTYTDSTAAMEYRAFKHVGLGFGIGSNALKVSEITNDYKFRYDNRITGLMLYAAAYF
jgi:hypothetical protein